jgi:multidrug efflux pump subunit AcrA (membrane-fusion protein)
VLKKNNYSKDSRVIDKGSLVFDGVNMSPPVGYRNFGATVVFFLIIVSIFVGTVEYAAVRKLKGEIQPLGGYTDILVPFTASVVKYEVQDGQVVKAGDDIVVVENIKNPYASNGILNKSDIFIEQQITKLQDSIVLVRRRHEIRMAQMEAKLQARHKNLLDFSGQTKLAEYKLASIKAEVTLHEKLFDKHLIHRALLVDKKAQLLEAQLAIGELTSRRNIFRLEASELNEELQGGRIEHGIRLKSLEMEMDTLKRQKFEQEVGLRTTLKAPSAGIVNFNLGENRGAVVSETVIATIISAHSTVQGKVEVPADLMSSLDTSQPVKIRFISPFIDRYASINGKFKSVAKVPVQTIGGSLPTRAFTAFIEFESSGSVKSQDVGELIPGMLFEAEITLRRKTIAAWMLNSLTF